MTVMTVALGALAGCSKGSSPAPELVPGMVAESHDQRLRYSVASDKDAVTVKEAKTGKRIAEVPVGTSPEQILVGPDDTLYVTNRGGRSVSVIARGAWHEAARIPVGIEPTGLAVSPDNRTLYVVNSASLESADAGTLTAVDLGTRKARWEIPVGRDPRGVVVHGNTAEVIQRDGGKVKVDLQQARVIEPPAPPPRAPDAESPSAAAIGQAIRSAGSYAAMMAPRSHGG